MTLLHNGITSFSYYLIVFNVKHSSFCPYINAKPMPKDLMYAMHCIVFALSTCILRILCLIVQSHRHKRDCSLAQPSCFVLLE